MAQKGGKVDASGERIRSFRLVTDADSDAGIGSFLDPIRIDPVGTTIQPVSVVGTVTTTGGAGGGGAATIADAADVAQGATTDAAVISDVSGTLSAKLRGLVKIFADVWDSVNHRLSVAVGNFPSGFNVNNFPATQPVSGTVGVNNFPATQAVSGTVTTTPPANASSNVGQFGGNNVVTGTGAAGVGVPRVTVSSDSNVGVTQATLTKGTQGATGVTTQDLKDAGRSARTITLDSFAVAATAETLMTMSYSSDNGTLTTGTSYSVTAAKRLRIQSILVNIHTIAGNTTAVAVIVRLRVNNGGAALVSSPVQMVIAVQGVAAALQAGIPVDVPIPDGWEFVAGAGIGVTVGCGGFVATTAAPKVDISIVGYEY